jgi:hypothetical protein
MRDPTGSNGCRQDIRTLPQIRLRPGLACAPTSSPWPDDCVSRIWNDGQLAGFGVSKRTQSGVQAYQHITSLGNLLPEDRRIGSLSSIYRCWCVGLCRPEKGAVGWLRHGVDPTGSSGRREWKDISVCSPIYNSGWAQGISLVVRGGVLEWHW